MPSDMPHSVISRGYFVSRPAPAQVNLLAKLPSASQTPVLHALKYADYEPGELIIREGVSSTTEKLSLLYLVQLF